VRPPAEAGLTLNCRQERVWAAGPRRGHQLWGRTGRRGGWPAL